MAAKSRQIPPWQALGFVQKDVDAKARFAKGMFKRVSFTPHFPEKMVGISDVYNWLNPLDLVAVPTFALGALGYASEKIVLPDWRDVGRQFAAAVVHYFYGPWRSKVRWREFAGFDKPDRVQVLNRKQARAKLPWISYYRAALPMALSLGDWQSADRLLEWPGPDLKDDQGYDYLTAEDNAYQIWLAMRHRGESGPKVDARRDLLARRSRPRTKLLALAGDALFAEQPEQFAKTLVDYLMYYREREIDLRRDRGMRVVWQGISNEGTVLWHLARRRGLGEIKLPKSLMIMIARPERATTSRVRTETKRVSPKKKLKTSKKSSSKRSRT
jgi:hypothetical protein